MDGKIICQNRAASHEYFILDKFEAGIVLDGGEVKSLRRGSVNLKDSFCVIYGGDVYVKNAHIATYDKIGAFNTQNSKRDRKLLLHKEEIRKISQKAEQKGLTIIPLKMYFKKALIKVEIGVCQGKRLYDKKRSIMEKDVQREQERAVREYNK